MNKRLVAKELLKMAKELLAIDFPTKDAMDKYLKDHPDADRSNHHVVETKKEEPKKERKEYNFSPEKKSKKTFSEQTDTFFDDASKKSTHDEHVEEMRKLVKKSGTQENLDKLQDLAKKTKASWGKKVVETIEAMKRGDFNNEFKRLNGGKPGGNHVSQTSELFSSLGQALGYND